MSYSYDATYDVYDETFPQARKEHTCDACSEIIPVGRRYARVSVVFDGGARSHKRCMRCQDLHKHLRSLAPGEMWPEERLDCGQDYEEEWGTLPDSVAALAFALPGETPEETRAKLLTPTREADGKL